MTATTPSAETPVVDLVAVAAVRYPLWLGTASFVWALVGWVVGLHASSLAFLPMVEAVHIALPVVTGVFILLNLGYALRALWWSGVRIDRLMAVTALQIGLFTTLFLQIAAHVGAEHCKLTKPTTPAEWVQFSLAHALKASDVLDTIEAYGLDLQVIKHRGPLVATLLVTYHAVVDLFVLGVLWSFFDAAKRKLMRDPELAQAVRALLGWAFLAFLVAWLASALYFRPWNRIDIPLWLAENVVRVVDFPDAMDSYDIHWHQVPKEWWESTLTFVCRIWILLGIGLLKDLLGRTQSARESLSVRRVARLAFVGLLFGCFVGLPKLFPVSPADNAAALAAAAADDARGTAALNALSRMGPNAESAVGPLVALLPNGSAERRRRVIDTLGRLGPGALSHLAAVAEGPDAELALWAVKGMDAVGIDAAPELVRVWKQTPHEAARQQADATLRDQGLDAMPKLIAAVSAENSAEILHWFGQLDRNWTLRGSKNEQFRSMVKNRLDEQAKEAAFQRNVKTIPALIDKLASQDSRTRADAAKSLGELGPAASEAVPALIIALKDEYANISDPAMRPLGKIGPAAVPALISALANKDERVRYGAARAIDAIGPEAKEAVPALITALGDKALNVASNAASTLGKIGPAAKDAVPALIIALADENQSLRRNAVEALGGIGPAARDAVPALITALANKEVRPSAIEALVKVGPAAVAALIAALDNDDWLQRSNPEIALRQMGAAVKDAVPGLVAALADKDESVRRKAANALEAIGPAAKDAVPALITALGDKYENVRWTAASALMKIGPAAKDAVPALTAALAEKAIRCIAAAALGDIGSPAKDTVPALIAALADADEVFRNNAAQSLGQFGSAAKDAVPALIVALADNNVSVRRSAVWGLGKIGPAAKEAIPALKKVETTDPSNNVRGVAGEAIERIRVENH